MLRQLKKIDPEENSPLVKNCKKNLYNLRNCNSHKIDFDHSKKLKYLISHFQSKLLSKLRQRVLKADFNDQSDTYLREKLASLWEEYFKIHNTNIKGKVLALFEKLRSQELQECFYSVEKENEMLDRIKQSEKLKKKTESKGRDVHVIDRHINYLRYSIVELWLGLKHQKQDKQLFCRRSTSIVKKKRTGEHDKILESFSEDSEKIMTFEELQRFIQYNSSGQIKMVKPNFVRNLLLSAIDGLKATANVNVVNKYQRCLAKVNRIINSDPGYLRHMPKIFNDIFQELKTDLAVANQIEDKKQELLKLSKESPENIFFLKNNLKLIIEALLQCLALFKIDQSKHELIRDKALRDTEDVECLFHAIRDINGIFQDYQILSFENVFTKIYSFIDEYEYQSQDDGKAKYDLFDEELVENIGFVDEDKDQVDKKSRYFEDSENIKICEDEEFDNPNENDHNVSYSPKEPGDTKNENIVDSINVSQIYTSGEQELVDEIKKSLSNLFSKFIKELESASSESSSEISEKMREYYKLIESINKSEKLNVHYLSNSFTKLKTHSSCFHSDEIHKLSELFNSFQGFLKEEHASEDVLLQLKQHIDNIHSNQVDIPVSMYSVQISKPSHTGVLGEKILSDIGEVPKAESPKDPFSKAFSGFLKNLNPNQELSSLNSERSTLRKPSNKNYTDCIKNFQKFLDSKQTDFDLSLLENDLNFPSVIKHHLEIIKRYYQYRQKEGTEEVEKWSWLIDKMLESIPTENTSVKEPIDHEESRLRFHNSRELKKPSRITPVERSGIVHKDYSIHKRRIQDELSRDTKAKPSKKPITDALQRNLNKAFALYNNSGKIELEAFIKFCSDLKIDIINEELKNIFYGRSSNCASLSKKEFFACIDKIALILDKKNLQKFIENMDKITNFTAKTKEFVKNSKPPLLKAFTPNKTNADSNSSRFLVKAQSARDISNKTKLKIETPLGNLRELNELRSNRINRNQENDSKIGESNILNSISTKNILPRISEKPTNPPLSYRMKQDILSRAKQLVDHQTFR